MSTLPVTIVILTWNEQQDLPGCLDALRDVTDDVLILDSFSTDSTTSIAAQRGIPVAQNKFTGFGDQRNWAIDHMPHKYPWVLHLDADERPTPEFIAELRKVLEQNPAEAGFYVPSKLMLGDQWLRYSAGYPVYQVRLFHIDRLRFANDGHGQREVTTGVLGHLKEPYLHFAFSKGITPWFEKHARYAAAEALKDRANSVSFLAAARMLFSGSSVERRRGMKRMSYWLPCRGTFRTLYMLLVKRGLLDGRAGLTYARMMSIYDQMYEVTLATQSLPLIPKQATSVRTTKDETPGNTMLERT